MSAFLRFVPRLNKIFQVVVLFYQVAAVIAFAVTLIYAGRWLKLPFLGALFEQTMAYNGMGPTGENIEEWDLRRQGIELGEQLVTVAGREIHNSGDLEEALLPFSPGENVAVVTRTIEGRQKEYLVTLHRFPVTDRNSYMVYPAIISVLFLGASVWIFGLRRTESAGRAFSIFATSLAIVTGTLFDLYAFHFFSYLWTLGLSLIGGALVDLSLAFPQEVKPAISRPYLRWIGYALGLILAANAFRVLHDFEHPTAYFLAWQLLYVFTAVGGLFFISVMIYHSLKARSPVVKSQARFILGGALVGLGAPLLWLLINPTVAFLFDLPAGPSFTPLLFLPLIIFPVSLGYTILRFRILQADDWVRQGLAYALLGLLVMGGFGMLVSGLSLIFKDAFSMDNAFTLGVVIFLVAVLLNPLRVWAQTRLDSAFFRGQRAYAQSQHEFTHKLSGEVNQLGISHALRDTVMGALGPNRAHLFIYDGLSDQYSATPGPDNRPTSDIRFTATSPLVNYFRKEHLPLYLDGGSFPAALQTEQARLALLGAHLFVRLPGKERPLGWLALGQRVSGQVYTPQELAFLD
ncbi:MAG: hypothetical protein AB1750_06810, partial [Chloroflexota bacterium]